ncbi:MAG: motility associated factor glycosyltransferase family protein, partial [Desulfurispora sp.]|uniref:motility associated factor glycosyltransferase family protein n=1 Tax=Desulfurispora sp. TaxID=3014275 RepID=UPI00404B7E43
INFNQDNRYEQIINFFSQTLEQNRTARMSFVVLPAYRVIYKDLLDKLQDYLKKLINVLQVNFYTNLLYHRQWCQNYAANFKYLAQTCPVTALKDSIRGMPAIIVAAGPSLTYELEHLSKVLDKALVVAVGTGLSILDKNEIKAHICGAIDGTKLEEDLFVGLKKNKDIALLYGGSVYHTVPGLFAGPKFLMCVEPIDHFLYLSMGWPNIGLYSGASIANIILYNLSALGCNPIIFLGQDFCYSRGKSYAEDAAYVKGSVDVSSSFDNNPNFVKVTNKKGEQVYTNRAFLAMRDLYENVIRGFPHIEYLNATSDGLSIAGARDIQFSSYIRNYLAYRQSVNFAELIEKCYSNWLKNDSLEAKEKIIKLMYNDNKDLIIFCQDIIRCIEDQSVDVQKKKQLIIQKEEDIVQRPLFREILAPLVQQVEMIFTSREYFDCKKNMYAYLLDKLLIMENAFMYEVNKK